MSTAHETSAAETHAYDPPVEVVVNVRVTALAFREADGRHSVVVPELTGCYSAAECAMPG